MKERGKKGHRKASCGGMRGFGAAQAREGRKMEIANSFFMVFVEGLNGFRLQVGHVEGF